MIRLTKTTTQNARAVLHLQTLLLEERRRAFLTELLASPLLNEEEKAALAQHLAQLENDPTRALGNVLLTVIEVALSRYAEKRQVPRPLLDARQQTRALLEESLPIGTNATLFLEELEREIDGARALYKKMQAIEVRFQQAQEELHTKANTLNEEMNLAALRAEVIALQEERLAFVESTIEEVEEGFKEQQRAAEELQEVGKRIIDAAKHWQSAHDRLQGVLNTGESVVKRIK